MKKKHKQKDEREQEPGRREGGRGDGPDAAGVLEQEAEAAAEGSGPREPERVYTGAELQERLAIQARESDERHLRVLAEYDNYRRRVAREKEQWTEEALERFATELLAVLDSFEKALALRESDPPAVVAGVELTDRQLRGVLQRFGVEQVDPRGEVFDPRFHEALVRVPSDEQEPGTVVEVFQKGYTLKGRLLRPARVTVAVAPEAGEA